MKKRRLLSVLLLLSCLFLMVPGFSFTQPAYAQSDRDAVIDDAGLFNYSERQSLETNARQTGEEIGAELVILTFDFDTGMDVKDYARAYLLDGGYGYGSGRESIIFAVDMYSRNYAVYEYNDEASGYLLTDFEGNQILDHLESSMRSGDYAKAANRFISDCEYYSTVTVGGNYDDPDEYYDDPAYTDEEGVNWLICVIIGLACGAIITGILLASRNNDAKPSAAVYDAGKGIKILKRTDHFTHTTTTSRKIERSSGGSGGGGGGGFSGGNSGGGHGGSRGF